MMGVTNHTAGAAIVGVMSLFWTCADPVHATLPAAH